MQTHQLDFLRTCKLCTRERDEELFTHGWKIDECDLCIRKAERIREGLLNLDNLSASGKKAARRKSKAQQQAAEQLLEKWKSNRRESLRAEGVPSWKQYGVMCAEENDVRKKLGLPVRNMTGMY